MESMNLNEKQLKAVSHFENPMMVLAGPGSGKTTVVIHRVKNLINKYDILERNILVITFTKASTEELRIRFLKEMDIDKTEVTFNTFHSLFFRILRMSNSYSLKNIIKEDTKKDLIKSIIQKKGILFEEEDDILRNIISEYSFIKNELIDIDEYNSINIGTSEFREIFSEYEAFKDYNNYLDFDDMLIKCYNLLKKDNDVLEYWQTRYKHILIDEFQDINKVQYLTMKIISSKNNNIMVVGDDDQSIYQFRGAKPEFLLNFEKNFEDTNKIILNINYRSTEEIIKISNLLISENKARFAKDIIGTNAFGNSPVLLKSDDITSEAIGIVNKIRKIQNELPLKEIAIIYRTNLQSRAFVDILMNYNIPYIIKDEMPSIYEHWISKDITAYLKLALDRKEDDALERIINKPKRYISKAIIKSARKGDDSLLNSLFGLGNMESWRLTRIEELIFYLGAIKKRKPLDAFKYIRKAVGYDDYIREYSEYRKINVSGLKEILDELQESSKNFDDIPSYLHHTEQVITEFKESRKKSINADGIILTTMHSAKGLEFNTVFLAGVVEGVVPYEKSKTIYEIEEERRLLYVGITRAKRNLYISYTENRYEKEVKPSRFLDFMLK